MTPADISPDSSDSAAASPGHLIPPPPPPRSTLPPVRKPAVEAPRAPAPTASAPPSVPSAAPASQIPPAASQLPPAASQLPPAGASPPAETAPVVVARPAGTGGAGIPLPPSPEPSSMPRPRTTGARPASPAPPSSGIGATSGIRWQGELEPIEAEDEETADSEDDDRRTFTGWLATAPSWLISTVLHLIIFIILALITLPEAAGLGKIVFELGNGQPRESVEFTEFEIATVDSPMDEETDEVELVEVVDMPAIMDTIEPMKIDSPDLAFGAVGESGEIAVPMFGGRSGAMKKALLAAYGGTQETQDAVQMGLKWLQRNQLKDGTWSLTGPYRDGGHSENRCSATAMAILAFAGDGNTHLDGPYKDEVNRGIRAIVKMQDRSGLMAHQGAHHSRAYAQAQATIAICELYGMTGDSWLRPYAEASIDYAVKAQSPQGGWRYQPRSDSDTSVTGWFVMALQSARAAGIEFRPSTLQSVGYFLDSVSSEDGAAYAYQPLRPSSAAMRAEGLLCRKYLGWSRDDDPMQRGIEAIIVNQNFDLSQRNVYYWYYATQALHHYGGSAWQIWNDRMREQLPDAQVKRGREAGSWAPQMDDYGHAAGRLYTTCLSIYCLEVYYRHMPIYDLEDE